MKTLNKKIFIICIIVSFIAIIISIIPTFRWTYLDLGHDGESHVKTALCLKDGLKNAIYIPYINEIYENGAVDNIAYPFIFKYIVAVIDLFINNFLVSMNIFIILFQIVNFVVMFISTKTITKDDFSSFVSAIFYQLFLYRLYNIYDRQAFGEYVAQLFIPLVIAGFYNIYFDDKKKWYFLVIGLSGIAQSHIVTIFYIVLLLIIFCLIFYKKTFSKDVFKYLCMSAILCVLLNIFFYIPFIQYLLEKKVKFTLMGDVIFDDFHTLNNIFCINPSDRSRIFNAYGTESFICFIILSMFFIYVIFNIKKIRKTCKENTLKIKQYYIFIILFLISLYYFIASLGFFSRDLIIRISFLNNLFKKEQWFYREIGRAGAFMAIALGICFKYVKLPKVLLIITSLLICLQSSLFYLVPCYNDIIPENGAFVVVPDYYPIENGYVDEEIYINSDESKNVKIDLIEKKYAYFKYNYEYFSDNGELYFFDVPSYYYTGYKAKFNHYDNLKIGNGSFNYIRVYLPKESGFFEVYFETPLLWQISKWISFITFIIFSYYIICKNLKIRNILDKKEFFFNKL